jgi:carbon storage regulator
MLVLSRQRGESIVMTLEDGRSITLTVVDIRGDKVRIGTAAPQDVSVHRSEVYEAIQKQKHEKDFTDAVISETAARQGTDCPNGAGETSQSGSDGL